MKYLPLIISIILHASFLLLAFLASSTSESGADKPAASSSEADIIPKQVDVDFVETTPDQGDIPEPPKPKKVTEGLTECQDDSWFGGIGIYQGPLGRIENVIEGYPAHKAGLLSGDDIVNTYGQQIRGEPGTNITITVYRESTQERLTFELIRDRICTGEKRI